MPPIEKKRSFSANETLLMASHTFFYFFLGSGIQQLLLKKPVASLSDHLRVFKHLKRISQLDRYPTHRSRPKVPMNQIGSSLSDIDTTYLNLHIKRHWNLFFFVCVRLKEKKMIFFFEKSRPSSRLLYVFL